MSNDKTPAQAAEEEYPDRPQQGGGYRGSYPKTSYHSERTAFIKGAEWQASQSRVLSKDYERLYDYLKAGTEVFASVVYTGGERDAKLLRPPTRCSVGFHDPERTHLDFGGIYTGLDNDRASFLESCHRLQLEWVATSPPHKEGS